MSLQVGDHLVIKRNGIVLDKPDDEGYHEFEVMEQPIYKSVPNSKFQYKTGYIVDVEVVI